MYWKLQRMLKQRKTQSKSDRLFITQYWLSTRVLQADDWWISEIPKIQWEGRQFLTLICRCLRTDHWASYKQPSHINRVKLFTENSAMARLWDILKGWWPADPRNVLKQGALGLPQDVLNCNRINMPRVGPYNTCLMVSIVKSARAPVLLITSWCAK